MTHSIDTATPALRRYKIEAHTRKKQNPELTLSTIYLEIARREGFASWRELKYTTEMLEPTP